MDGMSSQSVRSSIFSEAQRDVIRARLSLGPFVLSDQNVSAQEVLSPRLDSGGEVVEGWSVDHRQAAGLVTLPAGAEGEVERHGARYLIGELVEAGHIQVIEGGRLRWAMELGDRVEARFGGYQLEMDRDMIQAPGRRGIVSAMLREHLGVTVMVSIVAHMMVLAAAFMIPAEGYALNMDSFDMASRWARAKAVKPDLPEVQPEGVVGKEEVDEGESADQGGRDDRARPDRPSRPRARKAPRAQAPRDAAEVGLLAGLGDKRSSLFAGNLSAATDRLGQGTVDGGGPGVAAGPLALGPLGNPAGGSLADPGGRPGFKGRDLSELFRPGRHPGVRDVVIEEKGEVAVRGVVKPGPLKAIGNLSAEIIQGRIRSNMARFRYCYEQSLQGNPQLAGRVVVHFVIDNSGQVTQVKKIASTLGDDRVEACVIQSVGRLRFPSFPEGVVAATYPFVFARR